MRDHMLPVLVGGLLVAGGFLLGATSSLQPSEAGVASATEGTRVYTTSDEQPTRLFLWEFHPHGPTATRYRTVDGQDGEPGHIERVVYASPPDDSGK